MPKTIKIETEQDFFARGRKLAQAIDRGETLSPSQIESFDGEIDQTIKEADDPTTDWVSNESVKAESAKMRAAWLEQANVKSAPSHQP